VDPSFSRLNMLYGNAFSERVHKQEIILFGIGGVGSWCAEALVRSGVKKLTLVDSDLVCVTNINRQVQATRENIGMVKVEALRSILMSINPDAYITIHQTIYDKTSAPHFNLDYYDYTLDAIDSLSSKVELIVQAEKADTTFFSSLGASNRVNPAKVRSASIWKTEKCRLGRFVRKRLRKRGYTGDFQAVYSCEEPSQPFEAQIGCGTGECLCPKNAQSENEDAFAHEWCSQKAQINGSVVTVTATFGMHLASLVLNDIAQSSD